MWNTWTSLIIGILILVVAIPYVARIRHPEQKPTAAYLIFISVFIVVAIVLFSLLTTLVMHLNLGSMLNKPGLAILFLVLVFLPAFLLARWLARKPPRQEGPPP